jgi:hypothetical protein
MFCLGLIRLAMMDFSRLCHTQEFSAIVTDNRIEWEWWLWGQNRKGSGLCIFLYSPSPRNWSPLFLPMLTLPARSKSKKTDTRSIWNTITVIYSSFRLSGRLTPSNLGWAGWSAGDQGWSIRMSLSLLQGCDKGGAEGPPPPISRLRKARWRWRGTHINGCGPSGGEHL